MGRIIQQNNGKTTVYVTGEDISSITPSAGTYYLGVDNLSGEFEKLGPNGTVINFESITGGTGQPVIETTYNGLVNSITGGTLTAGSYYLMTDYQACYDQPNFDNYKDPITTGNYKTGTTEPILLLAISTTGFSPTVYSTLYPNDKITYDITWNTTEVTSSPAKGRITERIDDFKNRTDYDIRSIFFKRYNGYSYNENNPASGLVGISGITGTTGVLYGNTGTTFSSNFGSGSIVSIQNLNPSFFEVISVVSDSIAIISGVTINVITDSPYYPGNDDGVMSYYQPNIRQDQVYEYTTFGGVNLDGGAVNNYIGNYSNLYDWDGNPFILANNVFISGEYFNNTIGNDSYNNTFNDDCDSNQIGDSFYNNSTNDDFDGNIIGDYFNNNYITANFNNNRIGSDFNSNTLIGGSFYRNNIGNYFENNVWTNNDFQNNEIGNQFNNNKIYNDFYNNDIGNGYNYNESYSEFYRNLIGNGYNDNTIYSNFYENNIGFNFYNNTIGTNLTIGTYNFGGNIINNIFENNTILNSFRDNTIGNEFKGNLMLGEFELNDIGSFVGSNQFSGGTYNNKFGSYTFDNDFLGNVFANSCMVGFYNNTIGENFSYNNIGFSFGSNVIGENFGNGGGNPQGNIIGNNFYNNTIGEYFYNNSIPDNFYENEIGDYFQWNVINTNIDRTYFTLNYGNITGFSYTAAGTGATDTIYTNLIGTTNGHGVSATFDVEVSGGTVIGVSGNTEGRLYLAGDTITILGTEIGGVTGEISGFSSENLSVKIYKPVDSTYQFPDNETEMDYLIDNSPLFDTYYSPNIQGVSYSTKTGANQNEYGMVIDGYIQIPYGNTYYFGLSSDDGSDAFINGVKVADWYGAHDDNGNIPDGNQYPIVLTAGTYSVKVRLQERFGQDIVSLLYSSNSGSTWNIIPNNWFPINITGTTGSYPNIFAAGTGGENATFDVTVIDGVVDSVVLSNGGESYSVGEILTIPGIAFGGTEDITITVDSVYSDDIVITVTGVTPSSLFYEHYTKQIFERKGGNKRVSFYDEDDVLNVDSVYEISGYIPVYSQSLTFPIAYTSFNFHCDGVFSNNGGYTSQTTNNTQELVTLFNNNYRSFGYFFDNNDGTIGLYINPSLKQQYCSSGTYSIYVFND